MNAFPISISVLLFLNSRRHLFDGRRFVVCCQAGYQITQQRQPLAEGGVMSVPLSGSAGYGDGLSVRLARLQLEQDSGKSLHDPDNNRSEGRRGTTDGGAWSGFNFL